jgi:hypothetical protein
MPVIDYDKAKRLLDELFAEAELAFHDKKLPAIASDLAIAGEKLFASATQSYREVLLGCCLARLLDASINIRHPYVNQGDDAFNGRTLDERVVNPFLQERMIPCSKGPYLASFRRNVKFVPETGRGLRDKAGYTALLAFIAALSRSEAAEARRISLFILYGLCQLRDASRIPLSQISRLSLDQYERLLGELLQIQSGGLVPVLLAVAMLRTIKACFDLKWKIDFQGINVSDKASGAGGDITVTLDGETILAIEVTERPIEKSRVVSTFNTKVVRAGIQDYLFVYSSATPTDEARAAARTYFSQGHEINFVQVTEWITNNLATIGARCRTMFTRELLSLLDQRDVPASVKIAWNDIVRKLIVA